MAMKEKYVSEACVVLSKKSSHVYVYLGAGRTLQIGTSYDLAFCRVVRYVPYHDDVWIMIPVSAPEARGNAT